MTRFTRRQLLASAGVGGLGVATLALGDAAASTHYTYAQTPENEGRVKVAWFETYNGELLEHQGGTGPVTEQEALNATQAPAYVPEVSGPVLRLGNVMPGDRGRLAIGIELDEPPEGTGPFAIDLRAENVADLDPERPEPERKAPVGALSDALAAALWRDGPLTPCDGRRSLFDAPLGDGSMRTILDILAGDGVRVCSACFSSFPQHYCFGLNWRLPIDTGNAVQGDTVAFDLIVEVHDREDDTE